ncbi:BON domain-containing protein [Taibaiella chishuiensis]|uniref:BON domain-containing protein n=1 Tax=Taibaiella chishuiensis TaxID=1434707 RepID=A0A2P8DCF7_9BACT|nr:BON domain-containing protein [Taibaiella chishuiensis]PSK94889.1 BON domain-containing protein [Taibaiella chishuiensis]
MNLKHTALALTLVTGMAMGMASCNSQEKKDAAAKAKIEALAPGVTVEVKDGVATLSGPISDDATKAAMETAAKGVEGVKSVVNNTTTPPPPPMPAPVEINPDEALATAAAAAAKEYNGVTVAVKDGVVTLTGEIKKADLPKLMQAMNSIKPKKVDNKLTVK